MKDDYDPYDIWNDLDKEKSNAGEMLREGKDEETHADCVEETVREVRGRVPKAKKRNDPKNAFNHKRRT